MKKAKIISGTHEGKVGIVTGMFWGSKICLITFEDGTECGFKFQEVDPIIE